MELKEFIKKELSGVLIDLCIEKNIEDDTLHHYLLGWKDALEVILKEMEK